MMEEWKSVEVVERSTVGSLRRFVAVTTEPETEPAAVELVELGVASEDRALQFYVPCQVLEELVLPMSLALTEVRCPSVIPWNSSLHVAPTRRGTW